MSDDKPAARADNATGWWIYRGTGAPSLTRAAGEPLPPAPSWRTFDGEPVEPPPPADDQEIDRRLGAVDRPVARTDRHELDMVNAALLLRRPLLVTGRPGIGKSSLAYRVARELRLGRVLRWSITSRVTLRSGLYDYDAIGRAQAAAASRAGTQPAPATGTKPSTQPAAAKAGAEQPSGVPPIGEFVQLGPLGTALLPYDVPRVLLIDELDKSDVDLPSDLLHVFEEGEFTIPELVRVKNRTSRVNVFTDDPDRVATVVDGRVRTRAFPFVVITSNGEREFPPAFLRRCLRLEMRAPDAGELAAMVAAHFRDGAGDQRALIAEFLQQAGAGTGLAADQLLNAIHLVTSGAYTDDESWPQLRDALWRQLSVGP